MKKRWLWLFALCSCLLLPGGNLLWAKGETDEPIKTYTGGETIGIFTYKGRDLKVFVGAQIEITNEFRDKYFFTTKPNDYIKPEGEGGFPKDKAAFVEQETRMDVGFTYRDIIESRIRWEVQAFWDTDSEEAAITSYDPLNDENTKWDAMLLLEDAWASFKPFEAPVSLRAGLQDFKITHTGILYNADDYGYLLQGDFDMFYFFGVFSMVQESVQDRGNRYDYLNSIRYDRLTRKWEDNTVTALAGGVRGMGGDLRLYYVKDDNGYSETQLIDRNYLGLSAKAAMGLIKIQAELVTQSGTVQSKIEGTKDIDISGFAAMAHAEYDLGKLKVRSSVFYAPGDDKANDYKWESFMPIRQGLYGYFGMDGIWVDDTLPIAGVDEDTIVPNIGYETHAPIGINALSLGFEFSAHRKVRLYGDASLFNAGATDGLTAPTGKADISKSLGTEAGLGIYYRYSQNFQVRAQYSLFMPGDFFVDYYGSGVDETASNGILEFKWRF